MTEDPAAVAGGPVPLLRVHALAKSYGTGEQAVRAVERLDFELSDGEFVSIVGPSGCGKTTLLSCISGLIPATSGASYLRGARISGPPEGLSLVFQDYSRSLFPWMTVERNIGLPLGVNLRRNREARERVRDLIEQVGLAESVADQYPWQLSGGMQQRVAIARALVSDPEILIMDEPFASVDAQTRIVLEDLILAVRNRMNKTVLFVTHDIDEAVYLSDRVLVLSKSPSSVMADVSVPLPRPRNQITTKSDPLFAKLRAQILEMIMGKGNGAR